MDTARKQKLGTRWACFSCGVKFYDLNKPEPHCPKCGADQRQSPAFETSKRRPSGKAKAKPKAKPKAPKPVPKKEIVPPPPPPRRRVEADADAAEDDVEVALEREFEDLELDDAEIAEGSVPAADDPDDEPEDEEEA